MKIPAGGREPRGFAELNGQIVIGCSAVSLAAVFTLPPKSNKSTMECVSNSVKHFLWHSFTLQHPSID